MKTASGYSGRMLIPDEKIFNQIDMVHNEKDDQDADLKGLELLQNSPYKEKLASAGLFLFMLGDRSPELAWLVSPHFGTRLAKGNTIRAAAIAQATKLDVKNVTQIPALPLGSRLKLDPCHQHLHMLKT